MASIVHSVVQLVLAVLAFVVVVDCLDWLREKPGEATDMVGGGRSRDRRSAPRPASAYAMRPLWLPPRP